MGLRSEFALHHSGYEPFLFAPLWLEGNGTVLSVLSALARAGVDPWKKAAELAGKPDNEAAESLAAILARLPMPGEKPIYATFARQAVELLPRAAGKLPVGNAAGVGGAALLTQGNLIVALGALLALVLLGGWLM